MKDRISSPATVSTDGPRLSCSSLRGPNPCSLVMAKTGSPTLTADHRNNPLFQSFIRP